MKSLEKNLPHVVFFGFYIAIIALMVRDWEMLIIMTMFFFLLAVPYYGGISLAKSLNKKKMDDANDEIKTLKERIKELEQ